VRGTPLRVFNTHLQHNNAAERQAQIKVVLDHTGTDPEPTVLMGDMNARPDTIEYSMLTSAYTDAWPKVGEGPGYTFDADNPIGRIDYVMYAGGPNAVEAEVLQTLASDHLPLKTKLTLRAILPTP
jgi:endonuclease/exonuclease/phosphatase family metal-dependent hydrolase